jgi:DNA-binding MarR family transcriptional regulator
MHEQCINLYDLVPYTFTVPASRAATKPAVEQGMLDERATSAGLLLALLGQQAMRRLRAAHDAQALSPRQFHLLGLLHDRGAMTQRELGALMGIAPSVLVTLLNPLEYDARIARERDPADRRRHVVTLTPTGKKHLDRAARAQREAEDDLFADLSAEQREQLRELLLALRGRSESLDGSATH